MSDRKAWLLETLHILNGTDTMDASDGFTRLSFTEAEKAVHRQFAVTAEELGLSVRSDEAGNQWALWEADASAPMITLGSHLDTVDNGGGYDGVAGVLTALAAVKQLKDSGYQPKKTIAVICFVFEESARFGVSTIGSKAITGKLDKQAIADVEDRDGVTIREAAKGFGLDWGAIDEAAVPSNRIESFLELHIEQGTVLPDSGCEIGIVHGIACPVRLKVTASGMANHTGTTPMDKRQDAFAAVAPLVQAVQQEAFKRNQEADQQLVATVSTVNLKPNAMNVIPGEVELGIDIRSVDDAAKRNFAAWVKEHCAELESETGVNIDVSTLVNNDSVMLDDPIREKLLNVSRDLGYRTLEMNSGAGHDVMNMQAKWPSGLVFIPCKDGISHHPAEFASMEDIDRGVQVLAAFLKSEAGGEN
ncbi:M20 family metallo-hydrolase [Lentibacillus sediminis]|uniref:M20 family metallo-hydrolase n=1 Tax=Lentibacillus sediminis TaxID=1940529 RepID=UPI001EFC8B1B|nr:M20 family metallo-hydrolase [Lentibacillus sediminis]